MPQRLQAWLLRHWWRADRTFVAQVLRPLSWLYRGLLTLRRWRQPPPAPTLVPVVVVGNLVVGGAGKTPVVISLVQALRAAGWQPGVVSRGFGRQGDALVEVLNDSDARSVGDEPLLIQRRTGVPVWVGRQRVDAARALCSRHPLVDVLVADDGVQHRALARRAEWWVFDERGVGNGLLLPAGPLREPMPSRPAPGAQVLYSHGRASTALPGLALQRRLGKAWPLAAWWAGDHSQAVELAALRGRPLLAVAGIAAPEKFFSMLEAAGLQIDRRPQPDHAPYDTLPWSAGTAEVVTTEKDAVKLRPGPRGRDAGAGAVDTTKVWVVGLDLSLPAEAIRDLLARLRQDPLS